MPNHLHLILPIGHEAQIRRRINGFLSAVSRRAGVDRLWQPIAPPSEIPDRHNLRRQIRYVALNPCRKGICSDPLEWQWSTYRDLVGASAFPWVNVSKVIRELKETERSFPVRFHAYVSGDPSVAVSGTPFPKPALPKDLPEEPLGFILLAACAALGRAPAEITQRNRLRPVFLHLARRQGWNHTSRLAQLCKITPRAVQHAWLKKEPPGVGAAALCLGDPRFLKMLPKR